MPSALLRRLYDIEELSAERQPLPTASAQRKTMAGGGQQPSVRRPRGGAADQEDRPGRDEAIKFLKAVGTAGDEESFPARLAWELQSQLWPQQVEVTRTLSWFPSESQARAYLQLFRCAVAVAVVIFDFSGMGVMLLWSFHASSSSSSLLFLIPLFGCRCCSLEAGNFPGGHPVLYHECVFQSRTWYTSSPVSSRERLPQQQCMC